MTVIQQYASSLVAGLVGRMESLRDLNHQPTKGELRELFLSELLRPFLSEQFSTGTGVVVNQLGEQSDQIDIVIYDNRILPPFIRQQHIGVYPAESVVATIEVKGRLTRQSLAQAQAASLKLKNVLYRPEASIYPDFHLYPPLCSVLGFYGSGARELQSLDGGHEWIAANADGIDYLCLAGRWSWMRLADHWAGKMHDPDDGAFEETKRFIAVLLDNVRTYSERRMHLMSQHHRDWLGLYIRNQ